MKLEAVIVWTIEYRMLILLNLNNINLLNNTQIS